MKQSISTRLSFWIVLATALLFVGLILYASLVMSREIGREVDKDAVQVLDNTEMNVDAMVDQVVRMADLLAWFVRGALVNPDKMVPYAKEAVRRSPVLKSCSISFEPNYFPEKGKYYSIFAWRTPSGEIQWEQEGDDDYPYFNMDWYTMPKALRRTCWTEPYVDSNPSDADMDTERLVSCCWPVFTPDSSFVGSVSLDLSLYWLSESLYDIKPYPNSYCVLISKEGTYMVHPDRNKVFSRTILSDGEAMGLPELCELGESMLRQEEGKRDFMMDGQRYYVYYRPIESTGWSVAIFCPENDIYGEFRRMQRNLFLVVLAVLLLLFFVFFWLIRRQLAPLGKLAKEADFIAAGDFDRTLPPAKGSDEIGRLNRSFGHMQRSLVHHIEQLTESTASRERIQKELQIARNIQQGMVPHNFDVSPQVDIFASMTPARDVGGDLYDCFLQDDKLYFCIGDVSGKGVPASLFMAVSRVMFRVLARQGLSPIEIARRINDTVAEENEEMLFVTMFIASADLKTGVLDYCNCGHNAPVLISVDDPKPVFLDCIPNTAIGILPGFTFEGQQVGDIRDKILFLYTDGLNEAENSHHDQYGNERMLSELGELDSLDARTVVQHLDQSVETFVAGAEPSDDLTMLCVRIKQSE